jgi:hypothetical protein
MKRRFPLEHRMIRAKGFHFLAVVFACCWLSAFAHVVAAAKPISAARIGSSGQPTTVRASGEIDYINRNGSSIVFFADAPFWGPPRYGGGVVYLWPKDTAFELFVAGPTPITIDGKKASFRDLTVGQRVSVEYNFAAGGHRCIAYRIEAHSAPNGNVAVHGLSGERLLGHWRSGHPGYLADYWFRKDGTFSADLIVARRGVHEYSGLWHVGGNSILYDIKQSKNSRMKVGGQDEDKVIAMTNDYLVIEDVRGNQHRFVHLKD